MSIQRFRSRQELAGQSRTRAVALTIGLTLAVAACGSDAASLGDDAEGAASDVSEAVESSDVESAMQAGSDLQEQLGETDLSTLYSAMDLVGFDRLDTDEPFTFFAPNDSGFAALDADQLAALMADPASLGSILEDHLVTDTLMSGDLVDGTIMSEGGLDLVIDTSGPVPTVNGIEIVKTDLTVNNGVVHVIDGALLRESE